MANCFLEKLTADIVVNCDNLAIAGIEADILLIAHSDIDKTASTFDPLNKNIITDLKLKTGKTGFMLEGVKQIGGFNSEFVKGDSESLNKHKHSIRGRILSPNAANRASYDILSSGEAYIAVINKKYKGVDSKDAFLVLGWDAGLYMSVGTESSYENSGAILLEMASDDEMLENKSPKTLVEGTYEATLTAFTNKFLTV